jgi:hypothetical protein
MATVRFGPDDDAERPHLVLASFVGAVFDDLDALMAMRSSLLERSIQRRRRAIFESIALVDALSQAWESAQGRRGELEDQVRALGRRRLVQRGLADSELKAKILAWDLPRSRLRTDLLRNGRKFFDDEVRPAENYDRILRLPRVKRFRRFFKRPTLKRLLTTASSTLGYAKILLGSIVGALPGGDFLLEITELVERLTEDLADGRIAKPRRMRAHARRDAATAA